MIWWFVLSCVIVSTVIANDQELHPHRNSPASSEYFTNAAKSDYSKRFRLLYPLINEGESPRYIKRDSSTSTIHIFEELFYVGDILREGDRLYSPSHEYYATISSKGTFDVCYSNTGISYWSQRISGGSPYSASINSTSGALQLYSDLGLQWTSSLYSSAPYPVQTVLSMQNDRNLVIYKASNITALNSYWDTGTFCLSATQENDLSFKFMLQGYNSVPFCVMLDASYYSLNWTDYGTNQPYQVTIINPNTGVSLANVTYETASNNRSTFRCLFFSVSTSDNFIVTFYSTVFNETTFIQNITFQYYASPSCDVYSLQSSFQSPTIIGTTTQFDQAQTAWMFTEGAGLTRDLFSASEMQWAFAGGDNSFQTCWTSPADNINYYFFTWEAFGSNNVDGYTGNTSYALIVNGIMMGIYYVYTGQVSNPSSPVFNTGYPSVNTIQFVGLSQDSSATFLINRVDLSTIEYPLFVYFITIDEDGVSTNTNYSINSTIYFKIQFNQTQQQNLALGNICFLNQVYCVTGTVDKETNSSIIFHLDLSSDPLPSQMMFLLNQSENIGSFDFFSFQLSAIVNLSNLQLLFVSEPLIIIINNNTLTNDTVTIYTTSKANLPSTMAHISHFTTSFSTGASILTTNAFTPVTPIPGFYIPTQVNVTNGSINDTTNLGTALGTTCNGTKVQNCTDILVISPDFCGLFTAYFTIYIPDPSDISDFSISVRIAGDIGGNSSGLFWAFYIVSTEEGETNYISLFNISITNSSEWVPRTSSDFKNIQDSIDSKDDILILVEMYVLDNMGQFVCNGSGGNGTNNSGTIGYIDSISAKASYSNKGSNTKFLLTVIIVTIGGFLIVATITTLIIVYIVRRRDRRNEKVNRISVELAVRAESSTSFKEIKDIQIDHQIGGGNFGQVFIGTLSDRTVKVALKKLKKECMEDFMAEAKISDQLLHPNIVLFMGIFIDINEERYLVTEYCRDGSLRSSILKDAGKLSQRTLIVYIHDALKGMSYLEELNIIHRDLALRNLLLNGNVVKVADFGLSRRLEGDKLTVRDELLLPYRWTAPESISSGDFTIKSDIWSMGVTMWEIFSDAALPYANLTNKLVVKKVSEEGYRLERPINTSNDLWEIITDCWKSEPTERPSFAGITRKVGRILTKMSE